MSGFSKKYSLFRQQRETKGVVFTGASCFHQKLYPLKNRLALIGVLLRLKAISKKAPKGIPGILKIKFHKSHICTRIEHIHGESLSAMKFIPVAPLLFDLLEHWKTVGFVHGDLSPSNLIYDGAALWAIDCSENLAKPSGTPEYTTFETLGVRRSTRRDQISANLILAEAGKTKH